MKPSLRYLTFGAVAALASASLDARPVGRQSAPFGQSQARPSDPAIDRRQDDAPSPSDADDIVVTGERPLDPDFESASPALVVSVSGTLAAEAYRFVRCTRLPSSRLLRSAIDDPPNDPRSWWALDRIIRTNQGCYSGIPMMPPLPPSPHYGNCNPILSGPLGRLGICRSTYDRGALIESVLAVHAPDVSLTRADLADSEIRRRFLEREERLGRNRKPTDRKFAGVAGCLVLLEPERASRLVRSDPGSNSEARLRGQMLNRGRACVGNARKVTVDPAQFRIYVVNAVYGWVTAVRNVDSLVPNDG